jgi:hypothetical protein
VLSLASYLRSRRASFDWRRLRESSSTRWFNSTMSISGFIRHPSLHRVRDAASRL